MSDASSEDRGKPCRIWYDGITWNSFSWFPTATGYFTISIPIGWSFDCEADAGIVLRNTYGQSISPDMAATFARHRWDGFRVIGEEPSLPGVVAPPDAALSPPTFGWTESNYEARKALKQFNESVLNGESETDTP